MTDYKCKRCRDTGKFYVVTAGGDEVLVDCECQKVTTFPLERIARLQIELAQAKELIELKDEALTRLEAEFDATCEELRQVTTKMRQRFSVDGVKPTADLISQHALEVSHSLVRWADRIDRLSQDKDEALEAVWRNGCQEVSPALFAKVSKALGRS